jgi:hypothetical protein
MIEAVEMEIARRLQDDLNHARTLLDAAPVRELEKASSTG